MMRALTLTLIVTLTAAPLLARTLYVLPGADAHERLQSALIDAKAGDTVHIGAGRYDLSDGLSLDVGGVTITGDGIGKTILAFDDQKGGAEGLLITGNSVTVRDLTVRNAKGNGIKAKGVDQISFLSLRVEWSGVPSEANGAYGVYPVSSSNVLIDGVVVHGASDAGIYVGQSRNIVVQHSRAEFNVAGIEIENCYNADVHNNISTHNAGGILVFDLPGLPQMGGHSTRVFHNAIVDNDTLNFAHKGNIVASVPTGTGVMVMANRDIHVFDNVIDGNASGAILLTAYLNAFDDARYNPLPRDISVHDNKIGHNGFAPTFPGGAELAKAFGGALSPILWDGVTAYKHAGASVAAGEPVNLVLDDGPVMNLNLKVQGTPTSQAQPTIAAKVLGASMAQPAPVDLPAAQRALASTQ